MANFPLRSPTRFIGEMRVLTVYDPAFKRGGMEEVKKTHDDHLKKLRDEFYGA